METSTEDRLSELPDSIIFEIFGLLPMRELVRTSILSKRWKNLWVTTPYLDFDRHAPEFVNRVLILWRGVKILKFKFVYRGFLSMSMVSDIDLWVRLAEDCGVEEFYFDNQYVRGAVDDPHKEVYYEPHILFSCSSLKQLSLIGCNLQIHGNVHWNQLKSLRIEVDFIDQHSINQVFSGSPRLELFILDIVNLSDRDDNLSIRSSSLKNLYIEKNWDAYGDDQPSIETELRIWAPNLETLHLGGVPYAEYSLENVSSVTDLTLDFTCDVYLVGEIFLQIFVPALQHVEKVTLTTSCIQELVDVKKKYLLSPLSNCKLLTLTNSTVEYDEVMDLLDIFPKLETLVLFSDYNPLDYAKHPTSFLQVERNLPKSFLLQLRTVDINCIGDEDLIFTFIEFLLKHASTLQKMVIRVDGMKLPSMPWFWAQKLLRMPRASPTAELLFFA